ncbi:MULTISPECIES: Teichoic acid biosynthesis protein C (Precursor) [unclassified Streptomyces]|uniref:phage baseplate protein n=1 Tax=unclassified Streptomyces TaxID=2593676 RepID=UPI002365F8E5|nr:MULTISPECIES: Teichoic acid biosynthesis protein C (Precursor) [unclassified Streptomyces]MDF3143166.1 Teichoic acid biosynthesis protein C (Precursor) [Streptomyces sp. T21Q-yed]WDF38447.1 Teichoic acid biosynthesis protein C (Precursor) [Streptomyces sp. T12]
MTDRFDLAAPSERWLWKKGTLREPTILQSFAFDEVNRHLYVLQLRRGGGAAGHLCLNKLDLAGKRLGHMYLQGFGHGVSMGVQNDPDGTVWIWTEADAKGGYGRGVTRFRFFDGAVRTREDVKARHPIPGSTHNQPSVCMASRRIAVRHRVDDEPRYRVWDLDAFVARDYSDPVADFAQTGVHPDPKIPFQGYALDGDHLYQLAGTAYDAKTNPPAKRGNAHISCLDIHTGELLDRQHTEAGHSLDHREPEGLAVRHGSGARLCLGLASGPEGERRFSIYYKPRTA